MSCLICLKDCKNTIKLRKCNCKLNMHQECYQEFLINSNFSCPICRVNIKNNDDHILNVILVYLGKLPQPLSFICWFILSLLIIFFVILPMIMFSGFFRTSNRRRNTF